VTAVFLHLGILTKPRFGSVIVRQHGFVAWRRAGFVSPRNDFIHCWLLLYFTKRWRWIFPDL